MSFDDAMDIRVLMLGLDKAGKTNILYKLKLNEWIATIPTVGFNCECLEREKDEICLWDVGGSEKLRGLWVHYYKDTQALIWVIDHNDKDKFDESINELKSILVKE